MRAWLLPDYPDCRLVGPKGREHVMTLGGLVFEKVFCANCGADGGGVPARNVPHVYYLCDKCARTHGRPDMVQLPDDLVRSHTLTW